MNLGGKRVVKGKRERSPPPMLKREGGEKKKGIRRKGKAFPL